MKNDLTRVRKYIHIPDKIYNFLATSILYRTNYSSNQSSMGWIHNGYTTQKRCNHNTIISIWKICMPQACSLSYKVLRTDSFTEISSIRSIERNNDFSMKHSPSARQQKFQQQTKTVLEPLKYKDNLRNDLQWSKRKDCSHYYIPIAEMLITIKLKTWPRIWLNSIHKREQSRNLESKLNARMA